MVRWLQSPMNMRIPNKKNIIGLGVRMIIISISILVPFSCKISPNEETTTKEKSGSALIFLIPSDFNGTMRIVDDQNCGQKIKVVDGKREIEIPRNGILIVRDTLLAIDYFYFLSATLIINNPHCTVEVRGDYENQCVAQVFRCRRFFVC